jgi:hypothetical protein
MYLMVWYIVYSLLTARRIAKPSKSKQQAIPVRSYLYRREQNESIFIVRSFIVDIDASFVFSFPSLDYKYCTPPCFHRLSQVSLSVVLVLVCILLTHDFSKGTEGGLRDGPRGNKSV